MTTVRLPYPPTTNTLFVNAGKRRVRSKRYATWARHAENEILAQQCKPVPGAVSVEIVIGKPDRRKRDLDNLLKAPLDILVCCGLIEDDSRITSIAIRWDTSGDVDGAAVTIKPEGQAK